MGHEERLIAELRVNNALRRAELMASGAPPPIEPIPVPTAPPPISVKPIMPQAPPPIT